MRSATHFSPGAITALSLALTLALGGCAAWSPSPSASSSPSAELPVPTTWSTPAVGSPTDLAQWWQRFNDPLLGTLVTQALQANTSVRTAQAALQQSRALRDVQNAKGLPGVNASGSAQRSQTGSNDAVDTFKVGLDASWEPDVFGRQRNSLSATESDAQAAQASLADVQVSVAAEVALAYIQLRGQQTQLQIAQSNLASQQETLQITQWRAQAGLITSLEVEQALTSSEQTAAQVPALQASIAKTRHSLAVLTGQTPTPCKPWWPPHNRCRRPPTTSP